MPDTIRTFIAIELPQTIVSFLAGIQDRLKSSGMSARWVRPENIHLTLKFLGNIHTEDIDNAIAAMDRAVAGKGPIHLKTGQLGVFPNRRRPRVLWAGIGGQSERLCRLHDTLEEHFNLMGFPKETKPFRGHLTLGRFKGRIDTTSLRSVKDETAAMQSTPFIADAICLFKSDLKPGGAVYTKLDRKALSGTG